MSQVGYNSIVSYANTEQEMESFLPGRVGGGNNTNDVEIQNNNDDDVSIPDSLDGNQQAPAPGLFQQMIAECIGTCMLVQVGCAGYCVSTYLSSSSSTDTGSLTQWSIAMFWFVASVLAVSCTYSISGAHLNPAISIAVGLVRCDQFNILKVIPYWIAQISGAAIGAFINLTIFESSILHFEAKHNIVRGTDSSLASCNKTFGNYYMLSSNNSSWSNAVFVEAFGTAFLVLVYFAVTNEKNFLNKNKRNVGGGLFVPFVIGLAYSILIVMLGSFTGPGINPARDIGPRLITYYYGWGPVTIQGYEVYIIGPILGAPIGAILADGILF